MANAADTSVLISLESIQEQVQHCENIIENIDLLVPNLYKIRQQALSQKNYINDIQHSLMNNNGQLVDATATPTVSVHATIEADTTTHVDANADQTTLDAEKDKEPGNQNNPLVLKVTQPQNNAANPSVNVSLKNKTDEDITSIKINGLSELRSVVQSLYKYKHEIGTAVHFTTEQMDSSGNSNLRTKGLNLSDVESITDGLKSYLSIKSIESDSDNVKKILKQLFSPVHDTTSINLERATISEANAVGNIKYLDDSDTINVYKSLINSNDSNEITDKRVVLAKRKSFKNDGDVPDVTDDLPKVRGLELN